VIKQEASHPSSGVIPEATQVSAHIQVSTRDLNRTMTAGQVASVGDKRERSSEDENSEEESKEGTKRRRR